MVITSIGSGYYDFLVILHKYIDKNDKFIGKSLCVPDKSISYHYHPLEQLLSHHSSEIKYIEMHVFKFINKM